MAAPAFPPLAAPAVAAFGPAPCRETAAVYLLTSAPVLFGLPVVQYFVDPEIVLAVPAFVAAVFFAFPD